MVVALREKIRPLVQKYVLLVALRRWLPNTGHFEWQTLRSWKIDRYKQVVAQTGGQLRQVLLFIYTVHSGKKFLSFEQA